MGVDDESPATEAATMSRIFFFIREGLRALRRSAAPSLAAIVTVVITMLLLGVLIPVLQTTNGKTNEVRDQVGLGSSSTTRRTAGTGGRISAARRRKIQRSIPHVETVAFRHQGPGAGASCSERPRGREPRGHRRRSCPAHNPLPASFTSQLDDLANLASRRARRSRRPARTASRRRSAR